MERARKVAEVFGNLPGYGMDLLGSTWFFVCLAGTAFGLGAPFFPPLQHAVPVWVGLLIALISWTLAPLRVYHQLRMKIRNLEGHPSTTVHDVEGVAVINAAPQSNVSITQNITNRYVMLSKEAGSAVGDLEVGWKDISLKAEGVIPELEGGDEDAPQEGAAGDVGPGE